MTFAVALTQPPCWSRQATWESSTGETSIGPLEPCRIRHPSCCIRHHSCRIRHHNILNQAAGFLLLLSKHGVRIRADMDPVHGGFCLFMQSQSRPEVVRRKA
ncbi:hypothetical protein ACOMHN_008741 [Nucella lapillus]